LAVVEPDDVVEVLRVSGPADLMQVTNLANLRDVGGWPAAGGGRVRRGLLYRSMNLAKLDDAGLAAFGDLGIRAVFDLRTESERQAAPDRLPAGTLLITADVLAGSPHAAPAEFLAMLNDPKQATERLGDGQALEMFGRGYRLIVGMPSALTAFGQVFSTLLEPASRPALMHCTAGKDRTGWGAAALLMLLGVSEADVMRDYLMTNEQMMPRIRRSLDDFAAAGGDPEILLQVLGVREEYMRTAIDEMVSSFGTIERYFAEGLGIDDDRQLALRAAFVEPDIPPAR
jgi:protein-tyrosine phosphatase